MPFVAQDADTNLTKILTDADGVVEVNDDALDTINASVRPPTGTGNNGTVTVASSAAATQVPDAGEVPASAYILVLSNQDSSDMEWGYKADDTEGGILLEHTKGTAVIPLGANQAVEVWGADNNVVNWTTKII